jgi:hypothetical protein
VSRKLLARGKKRIESQLPLNIGIRKSQEADDTGLSAYALKPVEFASEVLCISLTPDQRIILNELRDSSEVNVQSCHGQGKTHVAAIAVIHWIFCVGGLAVTTAPTGRQTKELLWGEIRRIHGANEAKLGGSCQTLTLKLNESARGLGFSSEDTDENTSQGFHAENLLIVQDEACGISSAVDDGLTSCLTGENNKILRIGNPIEAGTPFEGHCNHHHIKLAAWRHPNVKWAYQLDSDGIHRLKPEVRAAICNPNGSVKPQSHWPDWCQRDVVPGAISIRWIENVRVKKGELSAYWQSRVEAEFCQGATDAVIPVAWLEAARELYDEDPGYWDSLASRESWRHGLDVGDGVDDHALASWRGSVLYQVSLKHGLNDRQDVSRAAQWAKQRLQDAPGIVAVDRAGVGAGALSQLLDWKCKAVGVHWGEAASDPKQFANSKAEQFWSFREALQKGDVAIAPLDPEIWELLIIEFSNIAYRETAAEKIQIERKPQTIARIGHSPNAAESVVLGFSAKASEQPKHYQVQASFTAGSVRNRCSSVFG